MSGTQDVISGALLLEIFSQAGFKQVRTNSQFFYLLRGFLFIRSEGTQ